MCFSYKDFTDKIVELDAAGTTPKHGLAKVAFDMIPIEIATETGKHVRVGLYGGASKRQVQQPTTDTLVAVEEAEIETRFQLPVDRSNESNTSLESSSVVFLQAPADATLLLDAVESRSAPEPTAIRRADSSIR